MSFSQTTRIFVRTFQHRNASNVAFIGVGQMGARMVKNLISKGEKVKVFDSVPQAASSVQGVTICNSPEEAAKDAAFVFTMLPNGHIVKDTLLGEKGIMKGIKKNALFIDSSTIEPQQSQELGKIAKENGFRFLDAPVSGGVTGAEAGTLTFMVGGEDGDAEEVKPILLKMGKNVFKCGGTGTGQIAKLCNNLILAITMIGTCESLNMGVKLGMDPKLLTNIINVSTGRSWSSDTYNPVPGVMPNVPSSNHYKGGFGVPLIAKDLALAESAALSVGAPLPLGAISHQLYRTLIANGFSDKDFAVVYEFLKGQK
ncbi:unnamed protein product [Acanthoscelides obtectus]|uniref:3-hydroxyisobutyrate dehydrogenase n=1 Tax=Acanthoscelides obtectus TaxID=200917 RepID=A0A9P0MBB9_ACAOB|nr:unnamed protein product [Acanthoscelides obtectus]CAK1672574.1 3-hydroxyisobutyrate dehydrogenase, mitochondrial [Acanthoscelides obtectus]